MGKLSVLMDANGRQIPNPKTIEASISWTAKDGIAQAFGVSNSLIAELHGARIDWIEAGGIRLSGMEPVSGNIYRIQQWQYRPA